MNKTRVVLLLLMVVLVASLEDSPTLNRAEAEPSPNNANDLEADASAWGYSRPWRYGGWQGGWGGVRSGWGWGGRGWGGRGGWW